MPTRRHLLTAALLLGSGAAFAQLRIDGHTYDATQRVADAELVLNGVGERAVAWFKGYTAGLYLAAPADSAERITAMAGPKRLRMRLLQNVPAAEFVKAIDKGIDRNTPAEQHGALEARRVEFDRQVQAAGEVKKGDVVDLDFVPGRGLVFTINGQARGEPIAGEDFYAAVLRIFIGDKPVDQRLKAGLLGKTRP